MFIERVNSPTDIRILTMEELSVLSNEIRKIIIDKVSKYGGHVGPDLGIVEATVALHYVFDSPEDKIVFDVSHQSFAHKIITGRRDAFINNEVSEYTYPVESPHDFFIMGHTSPSVSLCCGLAKGRDLRNESYNVIDIIGDGALSGGEAFEGLNNASQIGTNMIIVINDNQWSIAENHGGLYSNLKSLRDSKGEASCNYFKSLHLDYMYVNAGNDIATLIDVFKKVKDIDHPIVVHINTIKGKGYEPAIKNNENFHYMPPFDVETGKPKNEPAKGYSEITGEFLINEMKKNSQLIAVTSATPSVYGFDSEIRKKLGNQFIDVGIAEQHGVGFSSGVAKSGAKPVYGVYGTFLQRSFDQLLEDLCMNDNPAMLLVYLTGVYGIPDESHQCFFDIIEISDIPNMVYLAPVCKEEYLAMLKWGINYKEHPLAIRVPTNGVVSMNIPIDTDYSELNKYKIIKKGSKVAVIPVGSFFQLGTSVVDLLSKKIGIDATLINPRYLTGIDEGVLSDLLKDHELVVTLEDGIIDGGYGQKIAGFYGPTKMMVKNYGFRTEFINRYDASELMKAIGLTDKQIVEDIAKLVQ